MPWFLSPGPERRMQVKYKCIFLLGGTRLASAGTGMELHADAGNDGNHIMPYTHVRNRWTGVSLADGTRRSQWPGRPLGGDIIIFYCAPISGHCPFFFCRASCCPDGWFIFSKLLMTRANDPFGGFKRQRPPGNRHPPTNHWSAMGRIDLIQQKNKRQAWMTTTSGFGNVSNRIRGCVWVRANCHSLLPGTRV